MNLIFKHFGKLWLLSLIISLLVSVGSLALLAWAVIKLVNHFTGTPDATAFMGAVLPYLS
jgi:hypothetical protein